MAHARCIRVAYSERGGYNEDVMFASVRNEVRWCRLQPRTVSHEPEVHVSWQRILRHCDQEQRAARFAVVCQDKSTSWPFFPSTVEGAPRLEV
tara:strand:+ start:78 stop:356 length:279 start_codon:yes stop_codon:yes gene_type:complete